ncbi:MAG: HIT family protein [Candidatus Moraniibacteriota bacterium]
MTLFDKIISGEIKSWKVWEDENYLAFLTPLPNTPGMTVVIPKVNTGNYLFSLKDEDYHGLLDAARTVAKILEKTFDTPRVAMIFEGTGVAHVHAKLFPLHGKLAGETGVWSKHVEFYPEYIGYLTTVEGPRMSDEELNEVQRKIRNAQK